MRLILTCKLIWPQVYFGLLIFLGYMVYDTQEIIERAHHGDMDYIKHALTLFTDFVAVLVRILVIMVSRALVPDYYVILVDCVGLWFLCAGVVTMMPD